MKQTLLILLGICLLFACDEEPDFADVPFISNASFDKDTVSQSAPGCAIGQKNTALQLRFDVEDGNGDIGGDSINIYVWDSRFNVVGVRDADSLGVFVFRTPVIPMQGSVSGISALVDIDVSDDCRCCFLPQSVTLCGTLGPTFIDTMSYYIQMIDNNFNESNIIQSPLLHLRCD